MLGEHINTRTTKAAVNDKLTQAQHWKILAVSTQSKGRPIGVIIRLSDARAALAIAKTDRIMVVVYGPKLAKAVVKCVKVTLRVLASAMRIIDDSDCVLADAEFESSKLGWDTGRRYPDIHLGTTCGRNVVWYGWWVGWMVLLARAQHTSVAGIVNWGTACNTYLLLDYSYVEGRHVDSNTKQSNNGVEGHMIDDAVIDEDTNIHVSRYMRIGVAEQGHKFAKRTPSAGYDFLASIWRLHKSSVILANDNEGSEEENDCMDNVNEVKELPVV
ncbi:hypothetical protein BD769DRAFT_1641459 [Suillus cothurnatus]|nr:hypothetical protein BD769DRAFT_1641459 [Suillus cothurnatus]